MAIDMGGPGALEGPTDVFDQLLRHYDRASGKWNLEARGSFWEAVKIAHRSQRTGTGRSIAVLDGWCDTTIPRLRDKVRSRVLCEGAAETQVEHGTAVALLIDAVAPDAVIDFYGICDAFGYPQPEIVARALGLVAESDVSIVNLSAGRARSWSETLELHRGLPNPAGLVEVPDEYIGREECKWCGPADDAAARAKIIVAAVGNTAKTVSCPARSRHVIATGFFLERRSLRQDQRDVSHEIGVRAQPDGYRQSSEVAYAISQPPDALGSSFSAPLLSGALALGISGKEVPNWLAAGMLGSRALGPLGTSASGSPESIGVATLAATSLLGNAWSKVPHDHRAEIRPNPCYECSLFLEQLYNADSLLWLTTGVLETAQQRLLMIQRIMPWSPHAFVNYGQLLERVIARTTDRTDAQKLTLEAIRCYEQALKCTPPSLIAADHLARLRRE